ncbi:hypothetical protein KUTeg_005219 [Tegillarca granosa]|uniref:F-box domain-containing protein n=1 Tax=Tegillarca granosa TaxID=220873 RepID=A0ABQ9FJ47_TEGGR|nr:hypothetical protein KUTeg_005219 [Tegillarca granosa]
MKSRSAESSGSFSCDSYTPIQRSNGVMPNLSDKEVFSDDIDELTDLNTIYNSKSPSLESLKSVSSDSYLSIQKRDAKIQTLSDHGKYSNAEESNCHESNYSLKSPSTGSLVSMSSDSYIPIQRRDAKTQTVDTEPKLMADNKAKQNLKSPSSESLGSLSSDSYLPLTKSGIRLEYDSSVYNRGVPLSGRILPRQDNMPKIRNSSTQTWLLDRHISSANIELIRERSPLVENRTLLDDKYKNSQFFSDVPWNKMKENDKQRLGEFIIDKAMLRSEIDRRIEEKLQTRNKVLHENDPEIPLVFSQANKSYINGNIEFDQSNRKISNVEREQYINEHSLGSKVDAENDQTLRSDVCSTKHKKDLADEKSVPITELVIEKSKVLSHDGGSVTNFKDQSLLDKKIFNTKDTVLNPESEQEMVNKGGFRSESVDENSSKIKNKNDMCIDKKNISSSQSNNKTSNLGNEKVTNDRDSQLNESEFEQEVMTDFAKREFKPKVSSEENGSEDLHSPVSMDTLNDSGINISSSNDFNTEVVHEENIHRHVSPQTALKNRSFSIDEDGTCTQSERSFPSNNSKLEMEISTYGNENGHNQEASTKGKSLDNCQLKTSVDQDEHCVQLDHTYDENNIESAWLAKQKQSQDAMLADFTDTDADDDYCQSLTSIEDYRERMSITSSLDSRVDTSVYRKREEIRNRRHALFQIFSFLDTKSLVDIALVCREWRKVSRQSGLWKKVSLTYRKISTKFLMTISSWCTQTEHLILEGLQPRDIYEGESHEGYTSKISGSLEPGLERLLQQSESTLKSIRIVNCGRLLTDNSSPEKFDNKCLQIISQCCHDLVKLSIGGSLIDINGLVLVAKSCQRLLELEIRYGNDITEDIATAISRLGLNPLQCLRFIHTPVDDKAILQFYKSCKHLKLIQIDLSASDYVDDLVNEDNVKIFKKYTDKLTKLCKKPGLGNILKLHLNEAS